MFQRVVGPSSPLDLKGKTVLVVGATSGIGEATAHELAAAGATLVIAGRDAQKLERLGRTLSSKTGAAVHTVLVDLADLSSVAVAAKQIHQRVSAIHVLIASAGVLYSGNERQLTRDGLEMTLGVNHIGNAALILAVEDLVRAGAPSRIVVLSSVAHHGAGAAPFDDLMGERDFSGVRAYSRSKLANILFARELAHRLKSANVSVYAVHPGATNTTIIDAFAKNALQRWTLGFIRSLLLTPHQAARGVLRAAADPTLSEPSGTYFELGRPKPGSKSSNDAQLGRQLWDATMRVLQRSA